MDCLKAHTPIIFFNLDGCDILFPEIKCKYFYNSYSIDDLNFILNEINIKREFIGNEEGSELSEHIIEGNAVDLIWGEIEKMQNNKGDLIDTEMTEKDFACLPEYSIEARAVSFENPKSICVLGDDFGTSTGVAIPILNYYKYMSTVSDSKIDFILVKRTTSTDYIVNKAKNYSYIIINSLAFFFRHSNAVDIISQLTDKFIYVYAHETKYVIDHEKKFNSANFERFEKIASDLFFLCVSKAQKELFKSYGWCKSSVIYNCINIDSIPVARNRGHSIGKKIIMSGTIQDRKGIELFCKVADALAPKGYEFTWVGQLTPKCSYSPLSKNVNFVGFKSKNEVLALLQENDIFFLSSKDDPFPLSLLEAAYFNKKIVSYKEIGSFEALSGVKGYVAFNNYLVSDAINAIEKLANLQSVDVNTCSISKYFLPDYFSARMNLALKAYRYEAKLKKINSKQNTIKSTVPLVKKEDKKERALPYLDEASKQKKNGEFRLAYQNYLKALSLNPESQSAKGFMSKHKIKIAIYKKLGILD